MISLEKDLQEKKSSLNSFKEVSVRILNYMNDVISDYNKRGDYRIATSTIAGTTKYIRPLNEHLFIFHAAEFEKQFSELLFIFEKIKKGDNHYSDHECLILDSVIYTIQQSIGVGLDLLVNPNSARKHAGNRFEELIRVTFNEIGITNAKMVIKIPYEITEGRKIYKCENDLILSPYNEIRSNSNSLDQNELVVSVKTTSKDRMGKIFIDKLLLEKFVGHKQGIIGIFLNDVQRQGHKKISYTLVSGLFMVYTRFLTELEGIYYLDPPPITLKSPFNSYIRRFSFLLTKDLRRLLTS
jgi:hypothetical protein